MPQPSASHPLQWAVQAQEPRVHESEQRAQHTWADSLSDSMEGGDACAWGEPCVGFTGLVRLVPKRSPACRISLDRQDGQRACGHPSWESPGVVQPGLPGRGPVCAV